MTIHLLPKKARRIACGVLVFSFAYAMTGLAAGNQESYRAVFDAEYYYEQNPDLQTLIGADPEQLFSHFVSTGMREGRSGNAEFNVKSYVFWNPDLLGAYQTDLGAYCSHYVTVGKEEGRISLPQETDTNLIGTYTTYYNTTLPRASNIALAVRRVNGVTLQPGEGFSFSRAILPRIPENGYVLAPAIGRYEYGGGICQVSSTLYAAMCHALLPATERHPHSSPVSYLPIGLDATISEGSKDLQFVNIYSEPLILSVKTDEGALTASLYLGEAPEEVWAEQEAEQEAVSETVESAEQEAEQGTVSEAVESAGQEAEQGVVSEAVESAGQEAEQGAVSEAVENTERKAAGPAGELEA